MSELKTLRHAIDLIRLLDGRPPARISDLASELDISTSAAHRIASTLRREGLLEQVPGSRRYALAAGVSLGGQAPTAIDQILGVAPGYLTTLRDHTRETVHLAVRDGLTTVFPLAVESDQMVRVSSRQGTAVPLHTAANGKILLTTFTDDEIRHLLGGHLDALTEHSITDMDQFLVEISRVRAQGYATGSSETEEGYFTLAVPVTGPDGEVICAISVSAPTQRVRADPARRNDVLEDRLLRALRNCSKALTASLTA